MSTGRPVSGGSTFLTLDDVDEARSWAEFGEGRRVVDIWRVDVTSLALDDDD
jgi:hypothetical protein